CLIGRRYRHPRDAMLKRHDRVDRAPKRNLDWPSYLAGICTCREHTTESTNIKIAPAHLLASLFDLSTFAPSLRLPPLFTFGLLLEIDPYRGVRASDRVVQDRLFLDEDVVTLRTGLCQQDVVTQLALEAHVGDEPLPCLGVNAWQVSSVGVTVRVAILDVEQ